MEGFLKKYYLYLLNKTIFLILGSEGLLWRLDATIVMENSHGKSFVLPFLYVCGSLLFYTYQKILGLHKLE
jgi:hypothetical protein